jgi:hypothetical protein
MPKPELDLGRLEAALDEEREIDCVVLLELAVACRG